MQPSTRSNSVFSGPRASYVVLASATTLSLALLISIWTPDLSGATSLLGLVAIFTGSVELLLLYVIFSPASVVVDVIKLSVLSSSLRGRGWLIFFMVLEMLAKLVGTVFAWSMHRSISAGEDLYAPIAGQTVEHNFQRTGVQDPFGAYAPPRPEPLAPQAAPHYAPGQQTLPTSGAALLE